MSHSSPNDSRGAVVVLRATVLAVVSLTSIVITSCRMDVVRPSPSFTRTTVVGTPGTPSPDIAVGGARSDTVVSVVPEIIHLTADARMDTLFVRGQLRQRNPGHTSFYDPDVIGGWSLQVFVDNNPNNSIYWHGFDYVVRGVEWSRPKNAFVIRRITLDPNTPGGWGPSCGLATFTEQVRSFQVAIPLPAIGGFERGANYCVETYATIACPECGSGHTQDFDADYFGSIGDIRGHENGPVAASTGLVPPTRFTPNRMLGSLASLRRHGADADLRLVTGSDR